MTQAVLKLMALVLLFAPLLVAYFKPARAETLLTRIVQTAFSTSSAAVLLLFLVQLAVVILRSVFSVSLIWLQESTLYLFGPLFLLSAGALLLNGGHVSVDIFYAKLSARTKAIIDLAGLVVFVIPLSILIIWVSWSYVGTSWTQLERSSEASGIHAVFLLKSLIPAFAVLLAFAAQARVIALIRQLRGEPA